MKVKVTKINVDKFEVRFTKDDLRQMLYFDRGDGVKEAIPSNAQIGWKMYASGDGELLVNFELHSNTPKNTDLTQIQIDVWGIIRAAGDEGITDKRIYTLCNAGKDPSDQYKASTLVKVRQSLSKAGLITARATKAPGIGGTPRLKLWRSVE